MENKLEFKTFPVKEDLCKWVNQYKNITNLTFIVYDSFRNEYVVFFYWKKKED